MLFRSDIAFSVSGPHLSFITHTHMALESCFTATSLLSFWCRSLLFGLETKYSDTWHLQNHVAYAENCPDMKLLIHMPSVQIRSSRLCFVFIVQIREITYPSGKRAGSQYKDFSPSRTCAALFIGPKRG